MKIIIDDLSINKRVEFPNLDIKLINVGHFLSIKFLDKNHNIKKMEGFVQSIKHDIDLEYKQTTYIQIDS